MELSTNFCTKAKPFLAVIFMQLGSAGMVMISKFALNQGMSQHVLVVYRHVIATMLICPFAIVLERKVRPKITISIFIKILLLGLLEPTIDQNLYYTGMKYTTAAFAAAILNILPAFAFLMAWFLRLEKINIKELHSQAKILGTIVTVGGAMLMTLVKGTKLDLPWTKGHHHHQQKFTSAPANNDPIKGALMMTVGGVCWAAFINLLAITSESYPAALSLTTLICLMGAIEGTIVAVAMEWGNPAAWSIHMDSKLLAAVYSGVISSGVAYYIQGVVTMSRGPVFVSAFNPLNMVIVTILASFLLKERMYLGGIIGAVVIVIGLYLVLWGKSKDQPLSNSSNAKIASSIPPVTTVNEMIETSNQEFVAIDVTRATSNSESV